MYVNMQQFQKQNLPAKRDKKGEAALWLSHRKTESLGHGERGNLPKHQQLLQVCWMLAAQDKAALHILSFPSCSPVFHMSKQAGNLETHKNEITPLSSKVWNYHTESMTFNTLLSHTIHNMHWKMSHQTSARWGIVPRTTAGMGLGTNVQWALSPGRANRAWTLA